MSYITFRGNGETTGSPAYLASSVQKPCPPNCPHCEEKVSFKGRNDYDYFEYSDRKDKKTSTLAVVGGFLGAAAIVIGGLGYVHKAKLLDKIKQNGKLKDYAAKASETCYDWCHKSKEACLGAWEKLTNKK